MDRPRNAVKEMYLRCLRTMAASFHTDRATKGRRTIIAIVDLRITSVTGGTEWDRIRATTKFPDQMIVAATTSK
jgi:hypothetical protein